MKITTDENPGRPSSTAAFEWAEVDFTSKSLISCFYVCLFVGLFLLLLFCFVALFKSFSISLLLFLRGLVSS